MVLKIGDKYMKVPDIEDKDIPEDVVWNEKKEIPEIKDIELHGDHDLMEKSIKELRRLRDEVIEQLDKYIKEVKK